MSLPVFWFSLFPWTIRSAASYNNNDSASSETSTASVDIAPYEKLSLMGHVKNNEAKV